MCGIFGYFGSEQSPDALMERMAGTLHHRGPDGKGWHCGKDGGVGNTRLAIIDVEHGQQPFISNDGAIAVVQNGEIYNYKELMQELESLGHRFNTHCDTEVILRAYEQWGEGFVSRLNGMFAIAILDEREGTLRLYRDRVGIKPFYYYQSGNRFLFASEIKALLAAGIPREVNREALHHFLSFNYTPQPFTWFKDVKQVPSGHQLTLNESGQTLACWWDVTAFAPEAPASEAAAIQELQSLLSEATRIRLRSDVEVGAFLSGGVDSSSVVAYAAQRLAGEQHRLRTFSIGFEDARYDESAFAKSAAERFGTHHTNRIVEQDMLNLWPKAVYYCDQPHGDVSFMPTHCVSQLAAEHLKVVLTGDGGDELFAGYDKYKNFTPKAHGAEWQRAYFESISLLSHEQKAALYTDDMHPFASEDSYGLAAPVFEASARHGHDEVNQMLAFDMQYLLSGNNLPKPDRMGMAASIEARTPFLDYRLMEYALKLPGSWKLRDGETKYILKKAMCELIGEDLAYRKKQMFTVPIGDWFAGERGEFMRTILASNRFASRGFFQPALVQKMVQEHRSGEANHTRILRALIAIELWLRIFIDNDTLEVPNFEMLDISMGKAA